MSTITLAPRMSEKAYQQSLELNTYVFVVPREANTAQIKAAIEAEFKVTVTDVRTVIVKGKPKKAYRKGARPVEGHRKDIKKAYVTVKSGDKIDIFGEMEKAEEQQAKQQEAIEKAAARQDKKETKQKRGGIRGALGRTPRHVQNKGGDK